MRFCKVCFLLIMSLLAGCDVNFDDLGIPNNQASYRIKILDEAYDIAQEMSKYTEGVKADEETGELCIDTTIIYNEGSNIKFDAVNYATQTLQREAPFYLSGIADKNFEFVLKELNTFFSSLDLGPASADVDPFWFENVTKTSLSLGDPYLVFKSVDIDKARLKVSVENNLGFDVDSVVVKVCDADGTELIAFDIGSVADEGDEYASEFVVGIIYTQYIIIKVDGYVSGETNVLLQKENNLKVNVSFETLVGGHQIETSDYIGVMLADTIEFTWNEEIKIDRNADGFSDFDIYKVQTTYNMDNKLTINFENFTKSTVLASVTFPDVINNIYSQDTLKRTFTVLGRNSGDSSRTTENYILFSNKHLGQSYSVSTDLVDTLRVVVKLVFPGSNGFTRVTEDKMMMGMSLASLEIDQMECKVKEDVVFGENSGSIPVDLHRLRVTDKDGNEVKKLKMIGEPSVYFKMKPIIRSYNYSVEDMIVFETQMKSSQGELESFYADKLDLDVSPSLMINYFGNLPNEKKILNLLSILPEALDYQIFPTIKASDSLVVIEAADNMDVQVQIKCPISFDTEGDSLIFELREDYGDGFEGMRKVYNSSKVDQEMYDNYIDGEFVLTYKNTSNMLLGAQVIICTDKSVLYDDSIQTNATVETAGREGFPAYVARTIQLDNLLANTTDGQATAELSQRDLEPFLYDSCFVGVKISICGSAASFAGDLDLEGKLEFKYNNFGEM